MLCLCVYSIFFIVELLILWIWVIVNNINDKNYNFLKLRVVSLFMNDECFVGKCVDILIYWFKN